MTDPTPRKAARPRLGPLDWAMAALLAGAVGFVLLVIPPDPLPSAPMTGTRLLLAAPVALVTFLIAASLLRALNKPAPARARRARKPVQVASEPPRLRRADAHPDAPSRSPILAARELGVPLDEVAIAERRPTADLSEVENVDFDAEWKRSLPGFIDEDMRVSEAEAVAWEPVDEFEASTETPADIPFWVPDGAAPAEPEDGLPDPAEPAAPADDVPMAVPFRNKRVRAAPVAPESFSALIESLPARDIEDANIESLVERFESGLGHRPRPTRRGPDGDLALDQRLRSALGDLKKMAGRR